MDTPHTLIATAEVARSSGHGADRHLYRRGREARDSPLYILDYSWWERPGGWGCRPGNVPRGNIFGRPPATVVVAVAVASGTEGVRPRRLPPATEWDVATGIGPPPVKGAGPAPAPVTTTHDQRPARRRGKIQIRLALSGMGLVSCAPNIFGGLRVETMTQTEPPAAGDGPRRRARRRSGAAGDGRQRGRNEVEKTSDGTTSRSNSRRRTTM